MYVAIDSMMKTGKKGVKMEQGLLLNHDNEHSYY